MAESQIIEMLDWYVVHTKPQGELLATAMLEDKLNLQVYLPEVLQKFRGKMQLKPLFPRYLFVQTDLSQVEATAINSTPGVNRLVAFDDRPLPLRSDIIEQVRHEVESLNAKGGMPPGMYRPGDEVRLLEGPLKGLYAVFVRYLKPADRAVVLLRFLGQENEVEFEIENLERASAIRRPKKKRGTRGGGRKIRYKPVPTP